MRLIETECKTSELEGVSEVGSDFGDIKGSLPQADMLSTFFESTVKFQENQVVNNDNTLPSAKNQMSSTYVKSSTAPMNVMPPDNVYASNPTKESLLNPSVKVNTPVTRLPPPERSVFYGDPFKYPGWKAAFQTLIEQRQIPPLEQIHYLRKYLGESVKEVVENYFLITSQDSYQEAKTLLDQRYGDPFVIANAFRDKLEKWPKIASRDGIGLQKFSDFLKQCLNAMQSIGSLNALNDDRQNRQLLTKLPDWIVNRWSRIVAQQKEDKKKFPSFKTFVEFIDKESNIACDPVTSLQSLKGDYASNHRDFDKTRRLENKPLHSRALMSDTTVNNTDDSFRRNTCVLCQKSHNIDTYNPENERLVYALLDTQSDTTFVLDETRRALGLSETDVKLSLSTMHAENHIVDSRKIKGLMVRGFDSEVKIPLPNVFTRTIIPANRSHIPTAEMARRWSYLEHIAEKLMPVRDCEFGLLIGYNCPRALILREVIPSIDNGPYGQKIDLGWGIVGIVDPLQIDNCDSIGFSPRTLALEVPNELSFRGNKSGDPEHVYFSFGSSVKELIPSEVARMMELDFSDRNIDKISFSFDGKRFISTLNSFLFI
ncbi:unnamed protein product [Mytilus coruscus]|uniref:Peptidase aspartic putative domain-containing protein n=1 Tax=Mytilus coruscus TaxID=42192 RepID=A0A6J8BZ36_MYTCO|nr:unnamed protein product [Mytilus coruscus]